MNQRAVISVAAVAAIFIVVGPAGAQQATHHDFILRAASAAMDGILARQGLIEIDRVESPPGGEEVRLVRAAASAPPQEIVDTVSAEEPEVIAIEEVMLASLPETDSTEDLAPTVAAVLAALEDVATVSLGVDENGVPREVWTGYVMQAAEQLVGASLAREVESGAGAVVAVIDTGIDAGHPLFSGHLVPGYDFLREEPEASEWQLLDESSMAILGESSMAILGSEDVVVINESSMAILGEAQSGELDPALIPPSFGHGTMVAGIVHLVAPAAKIMPLRVFDREGRASIYDISRAIRYAVDHGATVINMSFSLGGYSAELHSAVSYALANGVACIASVGNEAEQTVLFPASLLGVFGVASTGEDDVLSDFSNYGLWLATVAAPGENVVTAYPGGGWASASGTSFAAPWISGAVALFAARDGSGAAGDVSALQIFDALTTSQPVDGPTHWSVLLGRVDISAALDRFAGSGN